MDKYYAIETDQDRIGLANMTQTICHLKDDNKHDVMAEVKQTSKHICSIMHPIS